ncbi:MAG: alpha-hydroxy-acid oxidizing protein [Phycisphaerales bacterium]|nr:alpha-hydroxy-acid oxidizing protein [Phycisphaerales bacterium]
MAYAYFAGGSGRERTLTRNQEAWEAISVWYRVMVDVSSRSMATTLFNEPLRVPLLAAPTALHKMAHPEGECATRRACSTAGIGMVLSSLSTTSVEEVCAAATGPVYLQLYLGRDRGLLKELVLRAQNAGCVGFQLTVDSPIWGLRSREMRTGFRIPEGLEIANLKRPGAEVDRDHSGVGICSALGWTISPSVSWKDLEWLCEQTPLPVLAKGVCRADDALTALRAGARGIVVSNHGGRQLDGAPPTAEVLPRIAEAVAHRVPVIVDGGIRSGVDIFRALALGATAVQVGRPILWGLSVAGEAGVARVIEILAGDLDRTMALSGCPSVSAITRDLLGPGR